MGARQFQKVVGFPTSLEIWKNPSHPLQFLKPIFNFPVLPLVPVHGIPVVWFRALVARVGRLGYTRVTAANIGVQVIVLSRSAGVKRGRIVRRRHVRAFPNDLSFSE